ncbi:MAG TPA: methionine synthase [Thermotogae bacterium]|nr:methionine synthase [Thermotogota bacterium]
MKRRKILGAAIGSDVHVAGLLNFLRLAESEGYESVYLGGAVSIDRLVEKMEKTRPDVVAISYRLGSEALEKLLEELKSRLQRLSFRPSFIFGGTVETAAVARKSGLFEKVFDGTEEIEDVVMYLRGSSRRAEGEIPPQTLPERVEYKKPYPLIRHHIGLPSLEETEKEISLLAESELLDIISLAPDQNCQQYFFEPEKMDHKQDGAGGAPIRSVEDFKRLYSASRKGNYPLMRCYAGTNHLVEFSKLLKETLNNAWAAIPIFWYSDLDRRSERDLLSAIKENMEAIRWNAENGVPVEVNDSHQWELRYAHDAVGVATAFIAAYVAKKLGVRWYVQQYMLNTPPALSPKMDIAKALAKKELVESLADENFTPYHMIRTGLLSMPADEDAGKGQLVSSMFYGSYLNPHIIHVVAYCEAFRRATSKEIIESVKMVKRAYLQALKGLPDFMADSDVRARVEQLKEEAMLIVETIRSIDSSSNSDPLLQPEVLYEAVKRGILDAPGLESFSVARGKVRTMSVNGAVYAVDDEGHPLPEKERLVKLL